MKDAYRVVPGLAELGDGRISYAERSMPLLSALGARFLVERPFEGLTIAACLHVTAETAVLVRALRSGGALVRLAASNPLSTQDDIAAALAAGDGVEVFAKAGVDRDTYYEHIALALAPDGTAADGGGPDLVIDDGGDLMSTLHTLARPAVLERVLGGCEGTTTGVLRLRRMAADGTLAFPVIAASDTPVTRLVDNRHGTAQSVIDGLLRASGVLLAGKTVVVAGFGACGVGIAESARALGARVVITEVDPVRALDAVLRGFLVLPLADAAPIGEVFITATGSADVITGEHLAVMRDGAILANAGHFDVEIDVRALAALAVAVQSDVRPHADAYELPDGRCLLLLAEGRVVNLVAANGHPPEVMDLAFGIEALTLARLAGQADRLPVAVHPVPSDIDAEAARMVLAALGTRTDSLTPAQRSYLASWRLGS
ncbi:MAG TPA: adenosylhomocysteinase [Streptosporangiaceae bacterium]|jgi:adenosylhomocysteinase|nr:adenosylhomocysteinase [Streptosporangiaceae bacterium]